MDEYLIDDPAAWQARVNGTDADIVLVGHTHIPFRLDLDGIQVVNPGSVGQPRDGDPRAAWLELDLDAWEAIYRRTEYDIGGAAAAIRAARLPASLAERLQFGQ